MARPKEARITDPATHPTRYVCAVVAAEYCELHRHIFALYVAEGRIAGHERGRRLKFKVADLVAFKDWLETQSVPRSA